MPRKIKLNGNAKRRTKNNKCVIPPRVADAALNRFTIGRNENEADRISDYVKWQCAKDKERVTYLEKVMSEHVFSTRYDCWNVRTNRNRYWVITNPTNLYSQKLFPSLDYTLSFHIGLTTRVQAQRKGTDDDRLADRLASAFRRWEQAAEALDRSEESEEVQAVGMRCRECLITLIRSIANPAMVPKGHEIPKTGDFIHWSELIANSIASGSSNQEIRGYLKSIAQSVWQLVSWLTHASNAVVHDGKVAVHATYEVLNSFGAVLIRNERKTLDRCPRCGSLRVGTIYKPDAESDDFLCESCGWSTSS
jgi:predicted RNA-binding Zn-ribbon protein involved in translation (DUF1610 family)